MQENDPYQMVRPGSEPLAEQVSPEVGSGVHVISIGEVLPRDKASHWSRHTCAFQTSCYLLSWGKWCLAVRVGESGVMEGN
jgi:hypothetical protein